MKYPGDASSILVPSAHQNQKLSNEEQNQRGGAIVSDLAFTCEGCDTQPEQISNIDLMPNPNGLTRATLCLPCLSLLQDHPPTHPLVVALRNRIEDFQREWPVKADMNFLAYLGTIVGTDPDRAVALAVDWHRAKKSEGLA